MNYPTRRDLQMFGDYMSYIYDEYEFANTLPMTIDNDSIAISYKDTLIRFKDDDTVHLTFFKNNNEATQYAIVKARNYESIEAYYEQISLIAQMR